MPSDSQIYSELRKMATEELIVAEEQTRGSAGMRRVYHVTEAGERAFTDWMNGPLKYQRTRDAAHLRAAYLESADQAAVYAFLKELIAHWKSELQVWEDEIPLRSRHSNPRCSIAVWRSPPMRTVKSPSPTRSSPTKVWPLVPAMEIEWAQRGLKLSKRLRAHCRREFALGRDRSRSQSCSEEGLPSLPVQEPLVERRQDSQEQTTGDEAADEVGDPVPPEEE